MCRYFAINFFLSTFAHRSVATTLLVFEPNFDGNPGAVMSVCKLVDGK